MGRCELPDEEARAFGRPIGGVSGLPLDVIGQLALFGLLTRAMHPIET
jgi:hypothetical protein